MEAQETPNDARSSKMTSQKIVEKKHGNLISDAPDPHVLKSSWGELPQYRGGPPPPV